jgi:hypothetical protein
MVRVRQSKSFNRCWRNLGCIVFLVVQILVFSWLLDYVLKHD